MVFKVFAREIFNIIHFLCKTMYWVYIHTHMHYVVMLHYASILHNVV